MPVRDRVLLIEGIAAPSTLRDVQAGLPDVLAENERAVFVSFAYADIPLGKTYQCWFWEDDPRRVERATAVVVAATQQFGRHLDGLPHGWKTIALLRFPEGVPSIVDELPIVSGWEQAGRRLLLGSKETYDARLSGAAAAALPRLLRDAALAGLVFAADEPPHEEVAAEPPVAVAPVSAPAPARAVEPAQPPRPGEQVCPACGTRNDLERRFCRRCGTPLADSPVAPAKARPYRPLIPLAVATGVVVATGIALAKWLFGWLASTPDDVVRRVDDVQCTVFAPPEALLGSTILVQVFAHRPEEADDARAIASELDVGTRRRGFRSLDAPVPVGGRLDFELRMPGLVIDEPVASLAWQGRTEAVQFGVAIPADAPAGTVIGTISIGLGGAPLGHVKFALAVQSDAVAAAEPRGLDARRYRSAFVSYASHDRDEVLRRVQMLSITGVRYFQDLLDLEPGEVWSRRIEEAIREADVFLLFWSSRAKASAWVRKEVDFALACKSGDDLSAPEIRPVIIEGPPIIAPWEDLAHLHFNDRILYFMSRSR